MQIDLTQEEISNLMAFINRASITGAEAEVAVALKQKLLLLMPEQISLNGTEPVEVIEK